MDYTLIFLLIFLAAESQGDLQQILPTAGEAQSSTAGIRRKKCNYESIRGMSAVDCSGMDLSSIPGGLRSNLEIMDASYNRIRGIKKSDLSKYRYLKLLYLGDNMIMNIERESLKQLQYLEVLDLSINSLQTIPKEIFEISTLRKLYLGNNSFDFDPFVDIEIPIQAQLEYVNLEHSHLKNMPQLGSLPFLRYLSLAGNRINKITVEDLLPHCRLQHLDISFIGILEMEPCECYRLIEYISWKKINITTRNQICYHNITAPTQCSGSIEFELNETYQKCKGQIQTRELHSTAQRTWLTVVLSMFGFLFLFVAVLYLVHRCNVKSAKRKEQSLADGKSCLMTKNKI